MTVLYGWDPLETHMEIVIWYQKMNQEAPYDIPTPDLHNLNHSLLDSFALNMTQ